MGRAVCFHESGFFRDERARTREPLGVHANLLPECRREFTRAPGGCSESTLKVIESSERFGSTRTTPSSSTAHTHAHSKSCL